MNKNGGNDTKWVSVTRKQGEGQQVIRLALRLKNGFGDAKKWVCLVNRGQLEADRGAGSPITASLPLLIRSLILGDEEYLDCFSSHIL